MGYASYDCKHCDHPVLNPGWTSAGINTWMSKGVLLLPNGTRIIGTMDDDSHRLGEFQWGELYGEPIVFAHYACWKQDGKPEYEEYDGPSKHSDQGNLSKVGHEMAEPGKEIDQKLWDAAIRLRDERLRRSRVLKGVQDFLEPPEYRSEDPRSRYEVSHVEPFEGEGKDFWPNRVVGWSVADNFYAEGYENDGNTYGIETEEEANALAEKLEREWQEGEGAEMLAEFRTWQQGMLDRFCEEMRASGLRYTTEKHPRYDNKTWQVRDADDYGDRIEDLTKEDAEAKAAELNAKWVADGMPITKHKADDWDHPMSYVDCTRGYDDPEALPLLAAEAEEQKLKLKHG